MLQYARVRLPVDIWELGPAHLEKLFQLPLQGLVIAARVGVGSDHCRSYMAKPYLRALPQQTLRWEAKAAAFASVNVSQARTPLHASKLLAFLKNCCKRGTETVTWRCPKNSLPRQSARQPEAHIGCTIHRWLSCRSPRSMAFRCLLPLTEETSRARGPRVHCGT